MSSPERLFSEFADSEEAQEHYEQHNRERDEVVEEKLQPLIADFLSGEMDIVEFRNRNNGLNKQHPLWGFDGFVGGMHFNKLLKAVPDESELEEKLRNVIQPPENRADARETIDAFAEYTQRLKENDLDSDPFPKSTIFFLSYFWHVQQPADWPLYYPTTEQYLKDEGRFEMEESYGASYVDFIGTMDDLREEPSAWLETPVEYRDVSNTIYWHEERDESEVEEEKTGGGTEVKKIFADVDKPYLPPAVADLDEVATGTDEVLNRYAPVETDLANIFERKCAVLLGMVGFDTAVLGQGSGHNPDGIAVAVRNDYAVIYDAKKREDGYRIGRDDRTIRVYIETHTRRLRNQGKQHIYFAIVSSSFRGTEESTLRDLRTNTDIDNIVLLKAEVLQELVRMRLEEPYLNLDDVEWVFGNRPGEIQSEELENIVPEWRQNDSGFSVSQPTDSEISNIYKPPEKIRRQSMSEQTGQSEGSERKTLPIEKGFPIERVNAIAEKEGWAKQYYRPTYTMHKWWARRLGSVFRSICLYTLVDDPSNVTVSQPGRNRELEEFDNSEDSIKSLLNSISLGNPDSLWELYTKDVRVNHKKVLDPFMGGGTTLGEASRFGVDVTGTDLNPVAWFVTKKQMDGYSTDSDSLQESFEELKSSISGELKEYYKTKCPNAEGDDDHKADVMYYFWVKELGCASCGESVSLFNDYRIGKGRYSNKGTYNVICPSCESIFHVDDWRSECECPECGHEYIPQNGNVDRGYICSSCGQKYGIVDAIQEQDGFDIRLYALEYHCPTCEERGLSKDDVKSYKPVDEYDFDLYERVKKEWKDNPDLREYIPSQKIPVGIMTDSTQFEGSIGGGHNLLRHRYKKWSDLYNERQLLSMSKLLREIDKVEDQNEKEYMLLAFSQALNYNTMMIGYHSANNQITNIFKSNSFDPPHRPTENNLWGAKDGTGTYRGLWEKIRKGIEYAHSPIERYIEDGETKKSGAFQTPIGQNTEIECKDMRHIDPNERYDAVITDPPYYDNIIYSEISEYFYVWQRILLEDEYEAFSEPHTPRSESIVANPAQQKDAEVFEKEIGESFEKINDVLKEEGVLVFSYHHSNSESWGELLTGLCDSEFEVTATYPISADIQKLVDGESVSFDIIVVARPAKERTPISWNSLRRNIYRTAQKTRKRLKENRDLSRGDIGVVEMGRCFHEYSKHHGKVKRAGETMTAKEVVDEIYGVIQHGSDIGEIDVFLDLLETPDASYDDLNKLCRGTNATPERMADMCLYRMDDGFTLGTWDDEKRIAYIQSRVENGEELTDLDRAQFLRYRWEHGKSVTEYLSEWEITDDLRELCEGLADATGDDTYQNILESRLGDY